MDVQLQYLLGYGRVRRGAYSTGMFMILSALYYLYMSTVA